MLKLKTVSLLKHRSDLSILPEGKLLINTINAHSYNTALKDAEFAEALLKGGALIPDGASMVLAFRWLRKESIERTAGWDLFEYEMERLNRKGGICYFLGSSKNTLKLIKEKAKTVYPNIRIETYSPPYKPEFTEEENQMMTDAINAVKTFKRTGHENSKKCHIIFNRIRSDGDGYRTGALYRTSMDE